MKCTRIKLCNRRDQQQNAHLPPYHQEGIEFITQEYHSFSFRFLKNKRKVIKRDVRAKITNIGDDDFQAINNGASLEKWAKKTPRLRSSREETQKIDSNIEDYDISFDFSTLFREETTDDEDNDSTTYIEYEIHSDIEELINKSRRASAENEVRRKEKKKRRRSQKTKEHHEDKDKRKVKKKLKKKIKFSLSKPPSPETEQVIRVDVTSNVSVEDFKIVQRRESVGRASQLNKTLRLNKEDEDFIIMCRQLIISPKDN